MSFRGFEQQKIRAYEVGTGALPQEGPDTPFPLDVTGPCDRRDLREVRPGPALDPGNGVWGIPEASVADIARGLRSPEFQVVRISALGGSASADLERDTIELVSRQIAVRETRFSRRIDSTTFSPSRELGALERSMGLGQPARRSLVEAVERGVALFSEITGERHIRVRFETQRGPRRLELEGGDGGGEFHIDAAGTRLVATLVGPGTLFVLAPAAVTEWGRDIRSPRRQAESLPSGEPFDLGRAVEASYRQLMMSGLNPPGDPIFAVPPGGGIIFQGSAGTARRPLVHAVPKPRDLNAALDWSRLLLFIDAA